MKRIRPTGLRRGRFAAAMIIALMMILTTMPLPAFAADQTGEDTGGGPSIEITGEIAASASSVSVAIAGELPGEDCVIAVRGYDADYAGIDYTNPWKDNANGNTNLGTALNVTAETASVPLVTQPAAGMRVVAYLMRNGETLAHSGAVTVQYGGTLQERAEQILANCSAQLTVDGAADGDIPMDTSAASVKVSLDPRVESCYMSIYAYPGNVSFDSENTNLFQTLWTGQVTDGFDQKIDFKGTSLPLPAYHKLVAVLNVPIQGDYYRTKQSNTYYITDENGAHFTDYTYPDVRIDEKNLEAGATSLHLTMTGDERIFAAAKAGQTNLVYSVGMYPDGDDFDFESEKQVALVTYQKAEEAFSGKEVTFAEPLREGWRVRAVVYWTQNENIFLPKGNDYEEMFHMPDDSVLVSAPNTDPKIAFGGDVFAGDTSCDIQLSGDIPEGAMMSVKSFPAGTAEDGIAYDKGTAQKFFTSVSKGTMTAEFGAPDEIKEGTVLAAFLLSGGEPVASAGPVAVRALPAPTVRIAAPVSPGSDSITVQLDGNVPEDAKLILFTFDPEAENFVRGDSSEGSTFLANKTSGVTAGNNTIAVSSLTEGRQVVAYLLNSSFDEVAMSAPVRIAEPAQALTVSLGEVSTSDASVDVTLHGEIPAGAVLLVKSYPAGTDVFETTAGTPQGVTPTAALKEGVITHTLTNADALKAGQKLVAFVLTSGEAAAVSEPVVISQGAYSEPTVAITDREITAGDTRLNFIADFDDAIESAAFAVYAYQGETFDPGTAAELVTGTMTAGGSKTVYIKDKIREGDHLVVVLKAADQTAVSSPITVGPSPAWAGARMRFLTDEVSDDAAEIPVSVDYADEYMDLEEFYCDVSVYMFDAAVDDDIFEEEEYWEKSGEAVAVAKANSVLGDVTRGELHIPLLKNADLKAGQKLIIKVRLPHAEWEGEEVDYVSSSIRVRPASEFAQGPSVLLYNVDLNSERGSRIAALLKKYGILYKTAEDRDLDQKVGYLMEKKGFTASEDHTGAGYQTEFMLMNAASGKVLNDIFLADGAFLDEMMQQNVSIPHKAIVTEINQHWPLSELIETITEEHAVMTAWIELNSLTETADAFTQEVYGSSEGWADFQQALTSAKALLQVDEDDLSPEALQDQITALTAQMNALTADESATQTLKQNLKALQEAAASYTEETFGDTAGWDAFRNAADQAAALLQEETPAAGALQLAAAKLEAAMQPMKDAEGRMAVQGAIDKIALIPDAGSLTLADAAVVNAAKAAYDALTPEQQDLVDAEKLNAAVAAIQRLQKAAGEAAAAQKAAAKKSAAQKAAAKQAAARRTAAAQRAYTARVNRAKAKKVTSFKAKAVKSRKAKLRWKASGVTGYQVKYGLGKKLKKAKTKTVTKKKLTLKKLKAGKTYYVKVRPYTQLRTPAGKIVKIYGKWSKAKKVKVRK